MISGTALTSVIVAGARTPIGRLQGSSPDSGADLGGIASDTALGKACVARTSALPHRGARRLFGTRHVDEWSADMMSSAGTPLRSKAGSGPGSGDHAAVRADKGSLVSKYADREGRMREGRAASPSLPDGPSRQAD